MHECGNALHKLIRMHRIMRYCSKHCFFHFLLHSFLTIFMCHCIEISSYIYYPQQIIYRINPCFSYSRYQMVQAKFCCQSPSSHILFCIDASIHFHDDISVNLTGVLKDPWPFPCLSSWTSFHLHELATLYLQHSWLTQPRNYGEVECTMLGASQSLN